MRAARAEDAGRLDAVLAIDNALPHLPTEDDLRAALAAAHAAPRPGGVLLASIRDYDALLEERPRLDPPRVLGEGDSERIVLQVWHWRDERRYDFDVVILARDAEEGWKPRVRTDRAGTALGRSPSELTGLRVVGPQAPRARSLLRAPLATASSPPGGMLRGARGLDPWRECGGGSSRPEDRSDLRGARRTDHTQPSQFGTLPQRPFRSHSR
jgi:hypothetical protein